MTPHRERPILFSGPMIRAILEGRKTQTRRVVKPQPEVIADDPMWAGGGALRFKRATICFRLCAEGLVHEASGKSVCPYGQRGDRLWVRETFFDHGPLPADGLNYQTPLDARIEYRATEWDRKVQMKGDGWSPSIYMPRWASRITLEITKVRAERLQEISKEDCIAEGVPRLPLRDWIVITDFHEGWDTINGKRKGCAWADNPFVWVISFQRIP